MPKKSLRELEKSPKKWNFKKQLKSAKELRRSKPTGGGVIAGKKEADPSPLANVPKRLRKFSTHEYQSKVENLDYSKKKQVEEWLKNKDELGLSFRKIEEKVKEELGEEISYNSLRRHLEWLKEQEEKVLVV